MMLALISLFLLCNSSITARSLPVSGVKAPRGPTLPDSCETSIELRTSVAEAPKRLSITPDGLDAPPRDNSATPAQLVDENPIHEIPAGLEELLDGLKLQAKLPAAAAWFAAQGLDSIDELRELEDPTFEANFAASLKLKPGREKLLLKRLSGSRLTANAGGQHDGDDEHV